MPAPVGLCPMENAVVATKVAIRRMDTSRSSFVETPDVFRARRLLHEFILTRMLRSGSERRFP